MPARVFIPQLPTRFDQATRQRIPTINVNPAARWGELTVIAEPEASYDAARRAVDAAIVDITPDDFILASGDVAILARLMARLIVANGSVKILRWEGAVKDYRVEEIRA